MPTSLPDQPAAPLSQPDPRRTIWLSSCWQHVRHCTAECSLHRQTINWPSWPTRLDRYAGRQGCCLARCTRRSGVVRRFRHRRPQPRLRPACGRWPLAGVVPPCPQPPGPSDRHAARFCLGGRRRLGLAVRHRYRGRNLHARVHPCEVGAALRQGWAAQRRHAGRASGSPGDVQHRRSGDSGRCAPSRTPQPPCARRGPGAGHHGHGPAHRRKCPAVRCKREAAGARALGGDRPSCGSVPAFGRRAAASLVQR